MRRAELIEKGLAALADADLALRDVEAGISSLEDVRSTINEARATINRTARELEYKFREEDVTLMPATLIEGRQLLDRLVGRQATLGPTDRHDLEQIIEKFGEPARKHLAPARVSPIIQINWHQLRRLLPGADN